MNLETESTSPIDAWLLFTIHPASEQSDLAKLAGNYAILLEADGNGNVGQILCPPMDDADSKSLFKSLISDLDHEKFAWDILHFNRETGALSLPCDGEHTGDNYLRQAVRVGASIEMILRLLKNYYGATAVRWRADDICTHTMQQAA